MLPLILPSALATPSAWSAYIVFMQVRIMGDIFVKYIVFRIHFMITAKIVFNNMELSMLEQALLSTIVLS